MLIDSVDVSVSYVFDARLVPKVTQTKLDRRCVWETNRLLNRLHHMQTSIMSVTLSLDSITPPPTGM